MIAVAHTLAGCAIASQVGSLPAIVVLGIISHFALDAIPHLDEDELEEKFNYKTAVIVGVLDFVLSAILVVLIYFYNKEIGIFPLVLGASSATAIDFIDNFPYINNYLRPLPFFKQLHFLHQGVHKWEKKSKYSLRNSFYSNSDWCLSLLYCKIGTEVSCLRNYQSVQTAQITRRHSEERSDEESLEILRSFGSATLRSG